MKILSLDGLKLATWACASIVFLQACGGSSEPPPTAQQKSLVTVTIAPHSGPGRVQSSPPGIDCPDDCAELFEVGQDVKLTQFPGRGSREGVFSYGTTCKFTRGPCNLTVSERDAGVLVVFSTPEWVISVSRLGAGTGVVRSDYGGIDCGASCTAVYTEGHLVTFSAEAAPGSRFVGWGGACSGAAACVVHVAEGNNVTATFE